MHLTIARAAILAGALLLGACSRTKEGSKMPEEARDHHSYSNPHEVRAKHLELDLGVSFERKTLSGSATLVLERKDPAAPLMLDTRDLKIDKVEAAPEEGDFVPAAFETGPRDAILGAPLKITLNKDTARVRVHYSTSPAASALQWLEPAQTAGRKLPFLYTQSQAIHARSWIPLQDTPQVRMTYRARVRTPKELLAVMAARMDFRLGDPKEPRSGDYTFRMPNPIPSYLIALAVGDLEFEQLSSRSGVYAERPLLEKAAREFEDVERMIAAAERLYGPYAWLRYDLLVLPPSFPYGGMENPLLTFATPTILAGDKSLVALVAHELAHSWSGNLVTNATWRDFWLNEGFTVYVERRILEEVYGPERARMEAVLGLQELEREMASLAPRDQLLHIDLAGRDPDEGVTQVPYEKGALLLTAIEEAFGREAFDAFLRGYFQRFRFQSITTRQFTGYLRQHLLEKNPAASAKIPLDEWLEQPGLPANVPRPTSPLFEEVDQAVKQWVAQAPVAAQTQSWNTHQWLHFLRAFPDKVDPALMAKLDRAYGFTRTGNSEILCQWLLMAVRNDYTPASAKLGEFLGTVGRRKFLKPLYEELVKTEAGRKRAAAIYAKARPGYHPIAATTIDGILGKAAR